MLYNHNIPLLSLLQMLKCALSSHIGLVHVSKSYQLSLILSLIYFGCSITFQTANENIKYVHQKLYNIHTFKMSQKKIFFNSLFNICLISSRYAIHPLTFGNKRTPIYNHDDQSNLIHVLS
jgi:lysylphosphatidylglycerol synthetase-like protein (DUF2156 family)